jgi:hypothetical protein
MPKMLLEDCCGEFVVDRTKIVSESTPEGVNYKTIPGRFSVAGVGNGNGRVYPLPVWEKNLQPGSNLQETISKNACFGLLEHPEDGRIDLRSPIAIKVTMAKLLENGEVHGEIKVLDLPEGRKLQVLIDEGYNPLVSSRGFGSLVKRSDGLDEVQEDFICEGWDVVIKPSFANAELFPNRSKAALGALDIVTTESKKDLKTEIKESKPSTGAAVAEASVPQQKQQNNMMDLKEIKERLNALRGSDVSKLSPSRFAEGMSHMNELHNHVACYVAENAKSSWDGNKLHDEISSLEDSWSKSAQAPQVAANKLREDNVKLLKVASAVVRTAETYRGKLGEACKKHQSNVELIEELTKRGRGWKARAESLEAKYAALSESYELATDGLDEFVTKYNTDLTRAVKKVITLEFKEKAQTPEIQKLLKEAKVPQDLVAIREMLEPEAEKPADAPVEGAKVDDASKPEEKKTDAAPTTESKISTPAKPGAESPKSVKEGKEEPKIEEEPVYASSFMESVKIARRLSAATAK